MTVQGMTLEDILIVLFASAFAVMVLWCWLDGQSIREIFGVDRSHPGSVPRSRGDGPGAGKLPRAGRGAGGGSVAGADACPPVPQQEETR